MAVWEPGGLLQQGQLRSLHCHSLHCSRAEAQNWDESQSLSYTFIVCKGSGTKIYNLNIADEDLKSPSWDKDQIISLEIWESFVLLFMRCQLEDTKEKIFTT